MTENSVSRRSFLVGACTIATLGMGSALLADDAQAATGIKRRKDGRVDVAMKRVRGLGTVGGAVVLGTVKGVPAAVVRTGPDTYTALDLRCTHQGVPVNPGGPGWSCPAHASQFEIDGDVVRGPAEANLAIMKSAWNPRNSTLTVG
jgi:Rieske Fe-S protein